MPGSRRGKLLSKHIVWLYVSMFGLITFYHPHQHWVNLRFATGQIYSLTESASRMPIWIVLKKTTLMDSKFHKPSPSCLGPTCPEILQRRKGCQWTWELWATLISTSFVWLSWTWVTGRYVKRLCLCTRGQCCQKWKGFWMGSTEQLTSSLHNWNLGDMKRFKNWRML